MLGSRTVSKNQKKNKNSNSQYTRGKRGRKANSNTYDVYDIEQSKSKNKKRSLKNNKSNEKINNIDIIEDIDKVFNENESNEKTIMPPLSPISISSETPEIVIEIPDIPIRKHDNFTIIINENDKNINSVPSSSITQTFTSNNNNIDISLNNNNNDDDDDDIEIINEKFVKYSDEPTIFETFTKSNILWCYYCGITHTSSWRHGPWGKKSLCNKHGCDYKGYGFTVRQPRLDLSKFEKEPKRIRPVIQEYCNVCFSNNSTRDNALVMCNGCYRAYHQNCCPDKISSDIVNSKEPYYCREECKHTRERKTIDTDLPRKNLPFMFNRGVTNSNRKLSKLPPKSSPKIITTKLKIKEITNGNNNSLTQNQISTSTSTITQNSLSVSALKSTSTITPDSTPITTPIPGSPAVTVSTETEPKVFEPEPKVIKNGLNTTNLISLNTIKEQRQHRKRGYNREEDKIVPYTKNLPPIIGFKHDEIPLPSWEIHTENSIEKLLTRSSKRKSENNEMLEDISDEAYIKRHHPLELSEKYSRCGSLINTSKIDEEAIHQMMQKQSKKRKLKKGYIYI
ncbi:hypothetical protein BCR32DRAFT_279516 [Anaeromyces robustus]|uniref:Zinc finger PHD-type domain-containing protein n=1 Tax=Anaeromyces robustus TaxID=1754192 RepID=A0A1Y1X7R8_9FUNG|nr:hypothetical protein BCR32DRAFT_279516 [Anaeromyces robustus]|eukprot:ORX81758.1 hypothetical protein BCR32DRAFT_279516 [Anaeromyces robustus]